MLAAEKSFDKRVYGGISYFAQAASGIALTYWLKNTAIGRKIYDPVVKWTGDKFISKISSVKGNKATSKAEEWVIVTTMVMMGNAFLLPVKWLENHKPEIVRKMNANMNAKREAKGEIISHEEREMQEAALAKLDKEPKQTWASLLIGRAAGLGAVYSTLWLANMKKVPDPEGFKNDGAGKLFVNTSLNQKLERWFAKGTLAIPKALGLGGNKAKVAEDVMRVTFYDAFYSGASAGGLYVYSHFLHPGHNKKKDDQCIPTPEIKTDAAPAPVEHDHKRADEVVKKSPSFTDKYKAPESFTDKLADSAKTIARAGV